MREMDTKTWRIRPREGGCLTLNDVATSQGHLAPPGSKRRKEGCSPKALERSMALLCFGLGRLGSRAVKSKFWSQSSCVRAPVTVFLGN